MGRRVRRWGGGIGGAIRGWRRSQGVGGVIRIPKNSANAEKKRAYVRVTNVPRLCRNESPSLGGHYGVRHQQGSLCATDSP